MKPRLVGIGEILWDVFPGGRLPGGAPANFACHAQALGGEGIPVSRVGADEPGRELLSRLRALGVCHDFVAEDPAHPTGSVTVSVDAAGTPAYTIHETVAWDFIPSTPALKQLAGSVDAVCFGTLAQRSPVSRATIRAFVAAARPSALCLFDINLRQQFHSREIVEESSRLAHVAKLNDEELPLVAEMFGLRGGEGALAEGLRARFGLKVVAVTRGSRGCALFAEHQTVEQPGCPTVVADTVGAGDAFTAALAMGLLLGDDLDTIARHANRVAAYVCSRPGAMPDLPMELRRR